MSSTSPEGDPAPVSPHDAAPWFEQRPFSLKLGWGPNGLRRLAPGTTTVVIVDVLSFSTSVDVALGRGAVVLPYRWHDGTEHAYAAEQRAVVAARRPAAGRLSLRPSSLLTVEPGTRLVLPSPNGSALAFAASEAGAGAVVVGCLRNATAVGMHVAARGGVAAVIAAGERWRGTTGPLRPAVEDLLGAGAILRAAAARDPGFALSPEARAAVGAASELGHDLGTALAASGSGQELIAQGHGADVDLAAALDASAVVPVLAGPELRPAPS